jgi:hypothetical protein
LSLFIFRQIPCCAGVHQLDAITLFECQTPSFCRWSVSADTLTVSVAASSLTIPSTAKF